MHELHQQHYQAEHDQIPSGAILPVNFMSLQASKSLFKSSSIIRGSSNRPLKFAAEACNTQINSLALFPFGGLPNPIGLDGQSSKRLPAGVVQTERSPEIMAEASRLRKDQIRPAPRGWLFRVFCMECERPRKQAL